METIITVLICILALIVVLFLVYLYLIKPESRKHEIIERNKHFLYAHRGQFDKENGIPENSNAAFKNAVARGNGFEFDVRLTKDGKLVVFHDDNAKRVAGVDLLIKNTDSEEVRKLRLDDTDEPIPYFSELLEIVDGKVPLIVEIKPTQGDYNEVTKAVCDMLDNYKGDYMLESFDPRVVMWLKKNRPELCRGLLITYFKNGEDGVAPLINFIIHYMLINVACRPDFLAIDVNFRKAEHFRFCKKLYNFNEVNWTVRSQEVLDECLEDGAMVIFEGFIPTQSPKM